MCWDRRAPVVGRGRAVMGFSPERQKEASIKIYIYYILAFK